MEFSIENVRKIGKVKVVNFTSNGFDGEVTVYSNGDIVNIYTGATVEGELKESLEMAIKEYLNA